MQDAKTFWNKTAAKYAKSPISDMESYEYTLGRTRSYLKPTDQVLEVGCGTGSTALLLAENVAHITGTDIADEMIAIARGKATDEKTTNASFQVADMLAPSKESGQYDVVLAHNVLHLIDDLPTSMAQIRKHLKPGGTFISKSVCAFGGGVPLKLRLILLVLPIMQMLGVAPFVAFRTIEDHEAAITDAGFRIVETGNYPKAPPSRYVVAIAV